MGAQYEREFDLKDNYEIEILMRATAASHVLFMINMFITTVNS